jgi:hypothetical protein
MSNPLESAQQKIQRAMVAGGSVQLTHPQPLYAPGPCTPHRHSWASLIRERLRAHTTVHR